MLLLIGNLSGIIIKETYIFHANTVKTSHLEILKVCYNLSFKWTCEDTSPLQFLDNIVKTAEKHTVKEFVLEIKLYMCIINNVQFILPKLSCAMLCIFDRQSSMKGESNIIKKLLEHCLARIPVISFQELVIA